MRETPDRWREEVRTAQPIVEYLVDTYAKTYDLKTPGGKARFVDALMPTIRAVPEPGDARRLPPARPSRVGRRGARAARGPSRHPGGGSVGSRVQRSPAAAPRVADAAADGGSRMSAEAIVAAADSLPISEILRGVLPQEAEFLRLLLLVPEIQLKVVDAIGPDQLPSTVARELFRAVVLAREPNDEGVHPPFSLTALVQALDPETAALAQAVIARRDPNPRDLSESELTYELDRLTIDLEERSLDERADYIASALAEAEQAADRDVDRPAPAREPGDERAAQVAPSPARPDPSPRAARRGPRMTTAHDHHPTRTRSRR